MHNQKNIWERRIAIVSTWSMIKQPRLEPTFEIAYLLLNDTEDLIHKATNWMLREAGKINKASLIDFLSLHSKKMLRYAKEKLN